MIENPQDIQPDDAPEKAVVGQAKKRKKRSVIGWLFRFFARVLSVLLVVLLLSMMIVQMPAVQKYGIEKATTYLSSELKTDIKIERFNLNFFDELTVKNLYVSNQNAPTDTLAHVGTLRVDISYWHLLWGIIQLDAARVEDVQFRLKRNLGQYDNNLQFIINYFDPPREGPPSPKKATDFRIGQLHLRNIDFTNDDKVRGQKMVIGVKAIDLHTNIMNLPKHLLDITRINVFDPDFHVEDFQGSPLPPRPKVQAVPVSINQAPPQSQNLLNVNQPKEKSFQLLVGAIFVEGGHFKLDNWMRSSVRTTPETQLDYRHLDVNDIHIYIHNFMNYKDEYSGIVDGIRFNEKSGFVLNKLIVGDAKVTPTETTLYGLQIETPSSYVGDTLRFIYPEGYRSFKEFENKVTLDARIHGSKVLMGDIMTFAVALQKNPFFIKNKDELASLDLNAFGRVNALKLPKFDIELGKGFHAEGRFGSKDLTNKNETYIDLDLKKLNTTMGALRELIPDFKPSPDLDRLGNLNFNGKFLGFFNDFTANGRLETEIGAAVVNMKLEPTSAKAITTTYKGNLDLENFDLGVLTQNPDLGKVTLKTQILRGRGFDKENVDLTLNADVDNFTFKNYTYKNFNLKGDLNRNLFSGKFESKDPNANIIFDGTVDIANATMPLFKFQSEINKLDLKTLNLVKEDFMVSGKLKLDLAGGTKLSDFMGTIEGKNLVITKDRTQNHQIDSLNVSATKDDLGQKHLKINSDILNATIDGDFNIEQIPNAIINHLAKNHPRLAADIGLKPTFDPNNISAIPLVKPHVFTYKININNTKTLTKLFAPKLDTLRNIEIYGDLDETKNAFNWNINTKETIQFDNVKIVEFGSIGHSKDSDIDWDLQTYNVMIDGTQDFKGLTFQNHVTGDTVQFGLTSFNFSQNLRMDTVELNAVLMRQDSFYKLSFGTDALSRINVFGDYWNVDKNNFILFGKDTLSIRAFELRNDERQITLQSCFNSGLSAHLKNFDVSFINRFIKDDRFVMNGKYDVNVEFEDVFKQKNFRASLAIDSFFVKKENRGALRVNAVAADFKSPIFADILLLKDSQRVNINGYYYPTASGVFPANSIDAKLNLQKYPFKTLQLLIENGASNFQGYVEGGVHVSGPVKKLNFDGALKVNNIAVTVDYLKTRLFVRDETVKITNSMFDATGAYIHDALGHRAKVTGGLTHDRFQNFGLKLSVKADTFLMLNTRREDNPLYYGYAVGAGDITFGGDFNKTDISIKAVTGKGTKIVFPFATEQTANETGFVVFKTRKNTEGSDTTRKVRDLRGINLDMQLKVTNQAEVNLIFDETQGDNIKGTGNGDLRLSFNRAGEVKMDGEYRIEEGDYLFTLLRVVNKKFNIQPGSSIRWNGSPFDATLNLNAKYKQLNASPNNFIAEYVLYDPSSRIESLKPTEIGLTLKLTGPLLKPDINFDLAFPRLSSNLKSYAESKLRILSSDQNELNRQVFGLIVLNTFLPSDIGSRQLTSGGINIGLESASNIVSGLISNFLSDYVKGVDIEVGYNIFDSVDPNNPNRSQGSQLRFRGSYDIDDRITLSGGVGVDQGDYLINSVGGNVFVGGDFIVDYAFTDDRRLKLRVSYTLDQVFQGRRQKPAVGVRYRQEFDSFNEFVKGFKLKKVGDSSSLN
jgi:TamB, inner membrane protein subunit of TAM complex